MASATKSTGSCQRLPDVACYRFGIRALIVISAITVAIVAAFAMYVAHELSSGPAGNELREVVLLPQHAAGQVGTFVDHFLDLNRIAQDR